MSTDPINHSTVSDAESNVQGGGRDIREDETALLLFLAKLKHLLKHNGQSRQDDSVSRADFPLGHDQHVRRAKVGGGNPVRSSWQQHTLSLEWNPATFLRKCLIIYYKRYGHTPEKCL